MDNLNPNMPVPHLLPQFGVDRELQRILNDWAIESLNALIRKVPKLGPAMMTGCQVRVKTDNGAVHFDVQVGAQSESPIIAVAEMPKNLPKINGKGH